MYYLIGIDSAYKNRKCVVLCQNKLKYMLLKMDGEKI